jgi:hypothetical protein
MRLTLIIPSLLVLAAAGCSSVLDSEPVYELPDEEAITNAEGARAALGGAYDALQSSSYYGETYLTFGDLSSDNAWHSGTFTNYGDADQNILTADNGDMELMWAAIYAGIGRVNELIARLPDVGDLEDEERNDILAQAHFLRALNYHNLVKVWGDVPLRLTPPANPEEAAQIARSPVADVYAQIHADLDQAEQLMVNDLGTRKANPGAIRALRARVLLYEGRWAEAEAEAEAVEAMGYSLAPEYAQLFGAEGADSPEDIFRVSFTSVEYNFIGYYYMSRANGGRYELAPEWEMIDAYGYSADPNYNPDTLQTESALFDPTDERAQWTFNFSSTGGSRHVKKYPTVAGAEHLHVIRFAEVLLIKAEAEARQGKYVEALATINQLRDRAGVPRYTFNAGETPGDGDHVLAAADVLDAVILERRLELAFEGDRWADLVRLGLAVDILGLEDRTYQTLWPIPQQEIDVAPNLVQNPGY